MKGKILVLDTAAFVKSVPIWDYAEEFYTCQDVIREIRDKQSKRFYKSLPVEVKLKEPSPESIHFINEFSKKTGDYLSLSVADSKVLALTYELDIQTNGGDGHLKKKPTQFATKTVTNVTTRVKKTFSFPKNIPGFYYPKKRTRKTLQGSEFSSGQTEFSTEEHYNERILEPKPELLSTLNDHLCENSYLDGYIALAKDFDMTIQLESYMDNLQASDSASNKVTEFKSTYPCLDRWLRHMLALMYEAEDIPDETMDYSDINVIPEVDEDMADESIASDDENGKMHETAEDDGWQKVCRKLSKYSSSEYAQSVIEEEDSDYNSDEEGWITSSTVHLLKPGNRYNPDEAETSLTACMSSDFSVQNVLKHIGLQVIGIDGVLIKHLKSYLLRCYACFKLCSNMERVFCASCGNKTLKRVSVSVNADGSQDIWINATRPINTKGINKPIPLPRGGKYAVNPILVADQRIPQQRLSKAFKTKSDPLDENYMAGSSYFGTRDIYSRAAVLGRMEGNNPNRLKCNKSKRKRNK